MKDKYRININELVRDYNGPDSIQIGNVTKNGEILLILRNKGADVKNGFAMGVTWTGEELVVHLDEFYKKLMYENFEIFKPLLFHEVGHFENGDFYRDPIDKDLRAAMLMSGIVVPQELNADRFSMEIVGKKAILKSLQYLLDYRKKNKNLIYPEAWKLGIKELELRIKNIKDS